MARVNEINTNIETIEYVSENFPQLKFREGAVYYIAARPGVGKTTILENLMICLDENYKQPNLFISLEMEATDVCKKLDLIRPN